MSRLPQNPPLHAAAFHEVYAKYGRSVHRFALFLCGNRALAEDIASETFLRLWGSASPIRMETVKGYLYAIARNLYLEQARSHKETMTLPEGLAGTGAAGREFEAREELQRTLEALQTLPETDRTALLMRAGDDLTYEEIARTLGLSVPAAKVKVHRARLKLAEMRSQERTAERSKYDGH